MRINSELLVDWSKFKIDAKGGNLEKAKNGFVKLFKMLNEVGFELISDYTGTMNKIELIHRFDNIKLNPISPDNFKRTYKLIINFKDGLKENDDEFIKFVGVSENGILISKIKTFDGGEVNLDISRYDLFNKSRQDFYNKLKEVGGHTTNYYINKETKMNIYIDDIKLNPMSPNTFKRQTYKNIINFKNKLKKNDDKPIKFIGLTSSGNLIAKINTFDRGVIDLDISRYNSFNKSRQDTYSYCTSKGYKILSSYMGNQEKILIKFDCSHEPNWITPDNLKKGQYCPICKESKGEKIIRLYLEKNNIEFTQEHRFDDCRHKRSLPFDFYIPSKNLCIEFDGEQHYRANNYFGGEEKLKVTQKRDEIKNEYCRDNGINLLRIPYRELDNIEKILDEEFKRLSEVFIKNNIA